MGCISGISKYIIFVFNFVVLICGIILIVFGSLIVSVHNKGTESITPSSVGGFTLAIGVLVSLVAFFGCCGAIKENSCMLTTYAVILIALFVIQSILAIIVFLNYHTQAFEDDIKSALTHELEKYYTDKEIQKNFDHLQQQLKCCGVSNYTDWTIILSREPPKSCCPDDTTLCTTTSYFEKGCYDAFIDTIKPLINVIGTVAAVFGAIELVGAIMAFVVSYRK